jgi:hypothetical protein
MKNTNGIYNISLQRWLAVNNCAFDKLFASEISGQGQNSIKL